MILTDGFRVLLSFCSPGPCLYRSCRAEVDTPAADLAPVFPDRLALFEIDIICRADSDTGTAGGAGACNAECLAFITGVGGKPGICDGMQKLAKDGHADVLVLAAFDNRNDLFDLLVGRCKDIRLFFPDRWTIH